MRFPPTLLRHEWNVWPSYRCIALVKVLIKRGQLFIIIIFMFSCLYKLIWIQVQHHLLKIQERRRPGLLRLLLRGKGDDGPRGVSSSSSVSRFPPPPPHSPPSPPALPPGPGSILTSPLEERKRPGLFHLLPRGKGGGGARGAPLLRVVVVAAPPIPLVPLLLPLLLPLLPRPPPPPRYVYCCVARPVDCCFCLFRSSPRAPFALCPLLAAPLCRSRNYLR